MNFTWFATSFATDDWLYRILTFVQMAGVLVLAAGIEPAFVDHDYALLVYGYVVMRVAMVAQWLRASRHAGHSRRATQIYAVGIAVLQVLWLLMLTLPDPAATILLVVPIGAELAVPVIAEKTGQTPWHPHHITESFTPRWTTARSASSWADATRERRGAGVRGAGHVRHRRRRR